MSAKSKRLAVWLRVVVVLVAAFALLFCACMAPAIGERALEKLPELAEMYWIYLIWIWVAFLPVFACLWLFWRVCARIGNEDAFCAANAKALRLIGYLAAGDTVFCLAVTLFLWLSNRMHPSLLIVMAVVLFAGIAVALCALLLARLVEKAAALKLDSDLTV